MNLKSDHLEILLGDLNELFVFFCRRHNQTMHDLHPGSYHEGGGSLTQTHHSCEGTV